MASTSPSEDLLAEVTAALAAAGLGAALIGGAAVNAFEDPRYTKDLDFTVEADPAAVNGFVSLLVAAGFIVTRRQERESDALGPDFVQLRRPGTTDMIDLIVAKTDYQELVIERATPHGDHLRVATPEDLIVLKLIANRSIDHIDADALARHNPIDWPYVEHWAEVWQVTERLDRLKAGLTPEA